MSLFWSFLIALGLCFDTFAVSVSSGIICQKITFRQACVFSIILAFFQGVMPLIGWIAGASMQEYIRDFDHWIAFGLLVFVGGRMIVGAFVEEQQKKINPLLFSTMLTLGIATSIDALAVGFTFALAEIQVFLTIALIGIITFLAAMTGLLIGKKSAGKFGKPLEIFGGIILIGIGVRILMEHL